MGEHDGTLRGPAANFDTYLDDTPSEIVEGSSAVTAQVAAGSPATTAVTGASQATAVVAGESLVDQE